VLEDLSCSFDSRKDGWDWRDGSAKIERLLPADNIPETTPLTIRFQVGEVEAAYTRMIRFKNPDAKGGVSDVTNFRRLKIRAPMAANPVYQTQPVMLDGVAFEAMMLNEAQNFALVNGSRPAGKQPVAIHEGDEVDIELVSAQPLCLEVISMDLRKRPMRLAPRSVRAISEGFVLKGEQAILGDGGYDRDVVLEGPNDADHAVIELKFDEPTQLNGLDFHWNGGQRLISIWALIDGDWKPLAWDGYDSGAGFHPTFSPVTSDTLRIKMACRGHRVAFQEISPYFNPHQRVLFKPLSPRE
jgi:hypothetical protein